MKALQKLVRNGNATHIAIPIGIMEHLRWRLGDPMIVELTEDGRVEIRPPTLLDLRTAGPHVMLDRSLPERVG